MEIGRKVGLWGKRESYLSSSLISAPCVSWSKFSMYCDTKILLLHKTEKTILSHCTSRHSFCPFCWLWRDENSQDQHVGGKCGAQKGTVQKWEWGRSTGARVMAKGRLRRAGESALMDALCWELNLSRKGGIHISRRTSCLCPSCLSLGCTGSKRGWTLSPGGQEGEHGIWGWFSWRGSFFWGGSSSEQLSCCQLPWKFWAQSLGLLRPQQAPPWGLARDRSTRVLGPSLTQLFLCLNLGKNPRM